MEHPPFQSCDNESVRRSQSGQTLGSDPGGGAVCLRLHRDYICRHQGACCTAGWVIPVEPAVYNTLRVYFGRDPALFDVHASRPAGTVAVLGRRPSGDCVFFEADRGRLCSIHRQLGAEHLPTACRQFPRIVLHDGRGVRISLSHYCPTAAELLGAAAASPAALFDIVSAPAPVTLGGTAEGLDARDALPPLLRPDMLMDLDAYDRWERRAIRLLAADGDSEDGVDAAHVVERIAAATRAIQAWRPGATPLAAVVEREFDVAPASEANEDLDADAARVSAAIASVPAGVHSQARFLDLLGDGLGGFRRGWRDVLEWWPQADRLVRRYLAARLFANWIAYHGLGLHAVVEYLRVCLAVLKLEAVRQAGPLSSSSPWQIVKEATRNADLLLVHLADPTELARRLSQKRQRSSGFFDTR